MFTINHLREYYLDLSAVEVHFRMQREIMHSMLSNMCNTLIDQNFVHLSEVQQHLIISTLIKNNVLKTDVEPDAMNRPILNESPVAFFNLETIEPYEDPNDWK